MKFLHLMIWSLAISSILMAGNLAFNTQAQAFNQTASVSNIVYPIAELNNCQNKNDCAKFCDKPDNINACASFAEQHNLVSQEEAARARQFASMKRGPGGCQTEKSCRDYCDDPANLTECLNFAKEYKLMDQEELDQAEKIEKVISKGAKLPGNCTNKAQCEYYCSDAAHAEECLNFAVKAGFIPKNEAEQARNFVSLIAKGDSPGKCSSEEDCKNYCSIPANSLECVAFAEKARVIDQSKAEALKNMHGRGPGNCDSAESCDKFCNEPNNQEVCFAFAEENNLIPKDKIQELHESVGRLRLGSDQAPPEIAACLKDNIGPNIIAKIEGGTLMPGQEIGELVKSCFDKYKPEIKQKINDELNRIPPETKKCLQDGIGDNGIAKLKAGEAPDPTASDKIRSCLENNMPKTSDANEKAFEKMYEIMGGETPATEKCLNDKIGKTVMEKISNGDDVTITPDILIKAQECAKLYNENDSIDFNITSPDNKPTANPTITPVTNGMPFESRLPASDSQFISADDCMKKIYGADVLERISNGQFVPPADMREKVNKCLNNDRTATE